MLFDRGSFPDGPQLDTKKALLLLDFQHDFVDPNGNLCVKNVQSFVTKLPNLVGAFRQQGDVVWACTEYRGSRPTIAPETGGFAILLKQFVNILNDQESNGHPTPSGDDTSCNQSEETDFSLELDSEAVLAEKLPQETQRCCLPGSIGASIFQPLASIVDKSKDIVVQKSDYSAFADMSLVFQLRTRMVTSLYVCGSLSNISVYATVLDAVRHGFTVTIVEDCLGYRDESCHLTAMRQMADNMGAEGIDYQELMDDLAGLLGDVINEDAYSTRYEVDLGRSGNLVESLGPQTQQKSTEQIGSTTNPQTPPPISSYHHDSSDRQPNRERSSTLESSPPRKRSTNDIDDDLEDYQLSKLSPLTSYRRQSYESHIRPGSREKKPKVRVRRKEALDTPRRSRPSPPQQSHLPESITEVSTSSTFEQCVTSNKTAASSSSHLNVSRKMARKSSQTTLGPGDRIGDGSSAVIYNILSEAYAKRAFDSLKTNVRWQKMYHRTGEVPRLVAVQGDVLVSSIDQSKSYPIYRHPSDESPELLPFDHTVDVLRRECEKHVGHPLNHVLIQHYRNSEDNISEHSDKTLDIVRNSSIVNLSLGAQRTMTLRTKKIDSVESQRPTDTYAKSNDGVQTQSSSSQTTGPISGRTAQRVPLPHGSLFILSTLTNAKYLHSIRADKRPRVEKSEAELAFNCERISLTFRHIGTFVTEYKDGSQKIWGQGAVGKTQDAARPVLQPTGIVVGTSSDTNSNSETRTPSDKLNHVLTSTTKSEITKQADSQAKAMIIGFGKENHESDSFDWQGIYGGGFDVVNFITKPVDATRDPSSISPSIPPTSTMNALHPTITASDSVTSPNLPSNQN